MNFCKSYVQNHSFFFFFLNRSILYKGLEWLQILVSQGSGGNLRIQFPMDTKGQLYIQDVLVKKYAIYETFELLQIISFSIHMHY